MAEIEITLPTVQYGNVKVRATPEEFGFKLDEPSAFGLALAVYQTTFTLGWQEGARMDVSAPVAASQEAAPGDPQAAADRLAGGRKPRTVDEANEMAKQVIENELGPTTEVEENDNIPWNREVARQQKPWENGTTATKAVDLGDDW